MHWISRLRHGSPQVAAELRGKRESELDAWCWQALLQGDAIPWLSSGTTRLGLRTRQAWIPLVAAVHSTGELRLPPFLAPLIPEPLWDLPPGWWPCLLGAMDPKGCLMPEGTPPELPWSRLQSALQPLVLLEPPPSELVPWTVQRGPWWVVDPHIRAWARGLGASPEALDGHFPAPFSAGGEPDAYTATLLQGKTPSLSKDWQEAVHADLDGQTPEPPLPLDHPVLDRLRMRWGSEAPPQGEGYPAWGEIPHPCADPFHWMAEGRQRFLAQDMHGALQAFTLAHAHFQRLNSPFWMDRAAANAEVSARFWGELTTAKAWEGRQVPLDAPHQTQKDAYVMAIQGDWEHALPVMEALANDYDLPLARMVLAQHAMATQDRERLESLRPTLTHEGFRTLADAYLVGMPEAPPEHLDLEIRLIWALHWTLKNQAASSLFWSIWKTCSNQPLRLGTALDLLEALPSERTVARLLQLQVLADRMEAPRLQARVRLLWPYPNQEATPEPKGLVQETLERLGRSVWVCWNDQILGVGVPPPEGAFQRLRESGGLPVFEAEGWFWQGHPIHWQGALLGHALLAFAPHEPIQAPPELKLLAPWLDLLTPRSSSVELPSTGDLLTDGSEPMATLLRELARIAPSSLPVLILGSTGSGKELVAQTLHRLSGRSGPLVPVNVSAFVETLLESELFGHVKGAFTGADKDRRGAIECAEGGTLFLDEVADLSPRLQSMLLRVLQDRQVRRVGSERSRHIDVRFLAATHKPLPQMAASGLFRRDLLFRLQGATLELPSLQARRHEFPYLVPRLVAQLARENRLPCPELASGLPQALARLPWPGNVRELRHSLQRALLRCDSGTLQTRHFPELEAPAPLRTWDEATREFQKKLLLNTLRAHHFQITESAAALGISRPALYQASKRLGLDLVAERTQDFQVD